MIDSKYVYLDNAATTPMDPRVIEEITKAGLRGRGGGSGTGVLSGAGIYEATGRADDNGWLDTIEGQKWMDDNGGARAETMYRSRINDPRSWETPRQIRLGLRFDIRP